MRILVWATLWLLCVPAAGRAQSPAAVPAIEIPAQGVTQELALRDGSSVIGRVESIGAGRFVFRSTAGVEMSVEMAMVRSLKPVVGRIVNGELWREDPNTTRLFFGPTARSLKRGEAYFGVYEVLLPFVQVGITDRFSIGGGTPLVFGDFERPFWVTPKFQVANRGLTTAAVGVLHFFNWDNDANVGVAYAAVTQGTTDSAVTVGAGYSYANTDDDNAGSAVVMIGGEHRVSRRIKFVTENYVFTGGGFASAGVRFFGEKLSADFGLVVPLFADDSLVIVPMVNIVRKF